MRRLCASAILVALSACSSAKPPAVAPGIGAKQRLADADALVRAGCYDCLVTAYREYDALRAVPSVAVAAAAGAVRAAALVAVRERELGMADEGYAAIARKLLTETPTLPEWVGKTLEVVDLLPGSIGGVSRPRNSEIELERFNRSFTNREVYRRTLRESAEFDELTAYTWLAYMCGSMEARDVPVAEIFAAVPTVAATPLVRLKEATCRTSTIPKLRALQTDEPRFNEISYFLGLDAVGRRKLDEAAALFQRAYDWHPRWPSLTLSMANVAVTAEEFDQAARLYDETLALEPRAVDALLGKVRALTYLARHEEAIATTDRLLAERWYLGDARYWRALNETQMERYEPAWVDIEDATKLLLNAQVPKLAGIIAYRRQQIDVARSRFELARTRNPLDCETGFYLGVILAEQRVWERSADVLVETGTCLQDSETRLIEEIATLRASDERPDRKARQIARRERDIAAGRRMLAQSWFNVAVANFSLARHAEARQYAEKVQDDEQFGERAKEILSRLPAPH